MFNLILMHLSHVTCSRQRILFLTEAHKLITLQVLRQEKENLENMLMSVMPRNLALQSLADMNNSETVPRDSARGTRGNKSPSHAQQQSVLYTLFR